MTIRRRQTLVLAGVTLFVGCQKSLPTAPAELTNGIRDDGYSGDRLDVTGDLPNLQLVSGNCSKGGFNDCISSIRFIRP